MSDFWGLVGKLAEEDVHVLKEKDKEYGSSWKQRGGVGAFMMLARKWDRINAALDPNAAPGDKREAPISATVNAPVPAWDILEAGRLDTRKEGILDDIADLRRYLFMVEAEIRNTPRPRAEPAPDVVQTIPIFASGGGGSASGVGSLPPEVTRAPRAFVAGRGGVGGANRPRSCGQDTPFGYQGED